MTMASVGWGVCGGVAEFALYSTARKIALTKGGLNVQPRLELGKPFPILPFEKLTKAPWETLVFKPLFHQTFLEIVKNAIHYALNHWLRIPVKREDWNWTYEVLIASAIFRKPTEFSLSGYKQGGTFMATMEVVTRVAFTIILIEFGLPASIIAHATSELCKGLLNQYRPEFLESSWEKTIRLLSPEQRKSQLEREAVGEFPLGE